MSHTEHLHNFVRKYSGTTILVIGDVMIDQFIWGNVSRISPEAPVPVLDVVSESQRLGGAANVINNLHALGANTYLCSVIGDDVNGVKLKEQLHPLGTHLDGLLVDSTRPTTIKTRIIAHHHQHHQQMVRLDRERREDITANQTSHFLSIINKILSKIDGIILEDYGKGVVTSELVHKVVALAQKQHKIVAVDPKTNHFSRYNGVSVITPNHHEAGAALNMTVGNHQQLLEVGKRLLQKLQSEYVLITRGKEGMSLFERKNNTVTHIPTTAQEVFDVTGAGDTVIAALTTGLASGITPVDAALLSNAAAGVVVGKVGTATVTQKELLIKLSKINGLNIREEKLS